MNTPADLTYQAADGHVGRLRLAGGQVAPGTWARIAELAELGDGRIHLTTRGNLRVRGIRNPEAFNTAAQAAGFRSGASLIASPLARLQNVIGQVEEIATTAALAGILLGIDDGGGDILSQRPDLGLQLDQPRENARLIRQGEVSEVSLPLAQALVALRNACGEVDGRQLPTTAGSLPEPPVGWTPKPPSGWTPEPLVGWIPETDGSVTLAAGLKFGVLEARVAQMLDVIEADTTVTPWQGLLIHGLSESIADQVLRVLAPLGLIFNAESPWLRVSACIAAPGCRHALSEVRSDAAQAAASGIPARLHFVGCSRNCGRPKGPHTLYQATGEGEYEVIEG
ncbi:ferredoxin-nitrite reductase [Corynebacterium occultum]|uniref:Ferredoxin-nitrite reductase n=1 Tax=Corynebacterium occultum TaxID=2675219 RepID=A0A6B8WLW1_9CORY|nr:precorrin-3B synthase [Corynebacterium occultum]QGU07378.1 ferredoxin-nitrite reductase [Corynebacterium occultum]